MLIKLEPVGSSTKKVNSCQDLLERSVIPILFYPCELLVPGCELYPTSYQANYLMKQLRGSGPRRLRPLISRTLTRPFNPRARGSFLTQPVQLFIKIFLKISFTCCSGRLNVTFETPLILSDQMKQKEGRTTNVNEGSENMHCNTVKSWMDGRTSLYHRDNHHYMILTCALSMNCLFLHLCIFSPCPNWIF